MDESPYRPRSAYVTNKLILSSASVRSVGASVVLRSPRVQMLAPPEPPPPFGHQLRQYFPFEPNYVNLNHG